MLFLNEELFLTYFGHIMCRIYLVSESVVTTVQGRNVTRQRQLETVLSTIMPVSIAEPTPNEPLYINSYDLGQMSLQQKCLTLGS